MKVSTYLDLSQEVEVEINAEQISVALSECLARAKSENSVSHMAPAMRGFAAIVSFLAGFSDEMIAWLTDDQRRIIAMALQTQAGRFKSIPGRHAA